MKNIWIYLIIILLAFFETTIVPLNLVLLVVIAWSTFKSTRDALWLAFISGLILDLLAHRLLGISSLAFLGVTTITLLLEQGATSRHIFSLIIVAFISTFIVTLITGGIFHLEIAVFQAIIIVPVKNTLSFIDQEIQGDTTIQLDFKDKLR